MASHKPSLQALVDIKGRSENLSLIFQAGRRNNTAKTCNRLQLSAQLKQKWHNLQLMKQMENIKVQGLDDVSTCCLLCTLNPPGVECHRGLSLRSSSQEDALVSLTTCT